MFFRSRRYVRFFRMIHRNDITSTHLLDLFFGWGFIWIRWQVLSLRAVIFIKPHVYSLKKFVMTDIVDSVGVRVDTITKHETLTCFGCKLGLVMRITNPAGCTEYFEVTHIGFLTDH